MWPGWVRAQPDFNDWRDVVRWRAAAGKNIAFTYGLSLAGAAAYLAWLVQTYAAAYGYLVDFGPFMKLAPWVSLYFAILAAHFFMLSWFATKPWRIRSEMLYRWLARSRLMRFGLDWHQVQIVDLVIHDLGGPLKTAEKTAQVARFLGSAEKISAPAAKDFFQLCELGEEHLTGQRKSDFWKQIIFRRLHGKRINDEQELQDMGRELWKSFRATRWFCAVAIPVIFVAAYLVGELVAAEFRLINAL